MLSYEVDAVDALELEVRQLHVALASRDVIGQAKGILMERFKVSADDAFDMLKVESQSRNAKLRDVAERLATTGEWDERPRQQPVTVVSPKAS